MSDYNEIRGFLSAASLRFQDHKSKIAQHISLALADDPKLNQNRIPEAAPVIQEENADEYYPPNIPDLYDPFAERLR